MPNRVHVFEDYETDIEKRWWLRGRLETNNVTPGSSRACRATETTDFDDLMGDAKAKYSAVVFNPVPGPPMGRNTRLSFRYWLKGTVTLRVQIYSLTNGYHRRLLLTGLPQEKWQEAAVDMTQARRPDGSGGPLSEDERIDDIQFYVEPTAELIIDDIVLYDAALPDEKRPFPKRLIFTGWFDTGKQGKDYEWPGDFEIVKHDPPRAWKAAKSVLNVESNTPWIRVDLRGKRPLSLRSELFFRYRLRGANSMRVVLAGETVEAKTLRDDEWSEATLSFGKQSAPASEIQFLVPQNSELLLDDVLLYEP